MMASNGNSCLFLIIVVIFKVIIIAGIGTIGVLIAVVFLDAHAIGVLPFQLAVTPVEAIEA